MVYFGGRVAGFFKLLCPLVPVIFISAGGGGTVSKGDKAFTVRFLIFTVGS